MKKNLCWTDRRTWIEETYGYLSDEYIESYVDDSATCLLDEGHECDHEWIPDSEIGVSFPAMEAT
jgi:hypothetical protein